MRSRVLFLVDRLELEDQAKKAFAALLRPPISRPSSTRRTATTGGKAEIVVTTVQSLLVNNKYQPLFSPTDFDLVISDEAHRSIGGNARAVFDYFVGYKLGLTATPRDYLRRFDELNRPRDPREVERRLLLDTYRTFGCESGQPTFRYSLLDGVKDGYLVNPTVVDARTDVTTELLSDEGFVVTFTDDTGEDQQEAYKLREFERRFFSTHDNQVFCKTFLDNALRDPVSGEIGKSIIFAVSQHHAARLTQTLNEMADRMLPGKYQSDFAVQVTSSDPRRAAVLDQLREQQPARLRQLPAGVQDQQGSRLRHRRDDDDRLRLHRHPEPRARSGRSSRPPTSSRSRVAAPGSTTSSSSSSTTPSAPTCTAARQDDVQALRLLRQLRVLRERVQLRRDPEAPAVRPKTKDDAPGIRRPEAKLTGRHLRTPGRRHRGLDQGGADRFRRHADRPHVLRTFRRNRPRRSRRSRGRSGGPMGSGHRLRQPRGLRQARGVLHRSRSSGRQQRSIDACRCARSSRRSLALSPTSSRRTRCSRRSSPSSSRTIRPRKPTPIPAIKHLLQERTSPSNRVRDIIDSRRYVDLATNPMLSTRDFKAVPEKYRTLVPEYVKDYVSLEPVRRLERDRRARHRHQAPHRHRPRHPRRQAPRPEEPGRTDHDRPDLQVHGRHGRPVRGARRRATFFAGDFPNTAGLGSCAAAPGGHEMLGLYSEAIARMPENPAIPPLFRDIFKNAFLPYRDPETLRAFLKVIDEFEYDHSERLGDAFEYLLSVLGSQGTPANSARRATSSTSSSRSSTPRRTRPCPRYPLLARLAS